MKRIKNYILLVDNYRRPSRRRNTAGRYRVGAKSPKEAIKILREKIKFGSIQLYYECNPKEEEKMIKYKQVFKETFHTNEITHKLEVEFLPVRSAIDPIK